MRRLKKVNLNNNIMSNTKKTCKSLIKDYCSNCTFAGVHFIADDTKHWLERLVWLVLVILSWYGSALLIIAAWDAFVLSPISFGVETTYTDWDTKMPAVAICELSNDAQVYNVSDTLWTPNHLLDLEDVLRDIAYFRGVSYSLVEICYLPDNTDPNCPKTNYNYYAKLIRSNCDQILKNCSYKNEEFSCCEHFQPIETDMGTCFIINSIQTKNPNPYPMINNLNHSLGSVRTVLRFEVMLTSMMYTLGEDEVPSITTLFSSTLKIQLGNSYRRMVSIRNIENDPLIKDTTPQQRACRFHDENEGGLYPHYSYSACTVLCRKRGQVRRCKCNDHFMLGTSTYIAHECRCNGHSTVGTSHPDCIALCNMTLHLVLCIADEQRCNISGVACLHSFSSHLTTLKPPWDSRPGLTCDCLPSCDETEITVIKDVATSSKSRGNKKRARVEIALSYLPTERFKRNVVRSRLDLVVSVGGTTGLFVGASLLSFVELFFFFTVRFINNLWMNKQKSHSIIIVKSENYTKELPELEDLKFNEYASRTIC